MDRDKRSRERRHVSSHRLKDSPVPVENGLDNRQRDRVQQTHDRWMMIPKL